MSHMYRYKPTHAHTHSAGDIQELTPEKVTGAACKHVSITWIEFYALPCQSIARSSVLLAFVITHTAAERDIRPRSFSYDSYMRANHSTAGGCWLQWHFGKKIPEPVVDCAVVSSMSARVDSLGNAGNAKPFLGLLPRQQAMHGRRKMLWEKKDEESMEELWHS